MAVVCCFSLEKQVDSSILMTMSPNEKMFKKEYALELLNIAENDFLSGQALVKNSQIRRETVIFHFEQAVEKALKAIWRFCSSRSYSICHRSKIRRR